MMKLTDACQFGIAAATVLRILFAYFAVQLLAVIGLCVASTVILNAGKGKLALVTLLPMSFIAVTTCRIYRRTRSARLNAAGFTRLRTSVRN